VVTGFVEVFGVEHPPFDSLAGSQLDPPAEVNLPLEETPAVLVTLASLA
jgi:hypothetical protein